MKFETNLTADLKKIIYFTVATKSYLAHGRAMGSQIHRLMQEVEFLIFLADEPDGYFKPESEPFRCVRLDEYIPTTLKVQLTFGYTRFELCNALKAFAHLYVQEHTIADGWVYLDSDILLLKALEPLSELLNEHSVVVTPHILWPSKSTAGVVCEREFLRYGVFNGGFLAMRRTYESRLIIEWLCERLCEWCFNGNGFFYVDQLWLNFLPIMAPTATIWRLPGTNVAHWNITERPITREASGEFLVKGEPLLFVHFSGWNRQRPELMSDNDINQYPASAEWRELASQYDTKLVENGWETCIRWPNSFDRFSDGRKILSYQRMKWWQLSDSERQNLGDAFSCSKFFYNRHLRKVMAARYGMLKRWLKGLFRL